MKRKTGWPIEPPSNRYRVAFDGSFSIAKAPTEPPKSSPDRRRLKKDLAKVVDRLSDHQRLLYAHDRYAILCVFQAMDAAGKDSTIRAVTTGISPAGFQVFAFRQPSTQELQHDFLWRTSRRLPERGRIGIFNRSYYEEVLVVRVHPELLENQRLPERIGREHLWEHRFSSIREHERHLARNGTVVLKFFLHVSKNEQRKRFLSRLREREKNWKFSSADVEERKHWPAYMHAYEEALRATSRPWAPWYAIPADDKPFMRLTVARILEKTFDRLSLAHPELDEEERAELERAERELQRET